MMTSLIASLMVALSVAVGATSQSPADEAAAYRNLPLHRLQVIGSHNSYKRAPQPELMKLMSLASRETDGIDYGHISITDQLNLGLRNLELDVLHDPEGGRYASPLGNRLLIEAGGVPWEFDAKGELRGPGFKVSHDADFDFRSWHHTLASALDAMRAWSELNPGHVPIIVTLNCKQGKGHMPGAVDAAEFDVAAMRALDAALATGVGQARVLRPDALRGESATLREAVTARGWPTVEASKGTFVFILDEGGQTRARYLEAFPGLRSAAMFVDVAPDQPEAAIFVINDPVRDEARIRDLTEQGFMVRTRADADTTEVRREDFTRFEAAKRSGAQIITTDYYIPDRKFSDRYVVRFEDGGFVRRRQATP